VFSSTISDVSRPAFQTWRTPRKGGFCEISTGGGPSTRLSHSKLNMEKTMSSAATSKVLCGHRGHGPRSCAMSTETLAVWHSYFTITHLYVAGQDKATSIACTECLHSGLRAYRALA